MLAIQYEHLALMPSKLKAHFRLIVVDDGSPTGPATPPDYDLGFPLEIYRIGVDRPWNQDAARNIAVHHAPDGWLLLTDMDHMVPEATLHDIMKNTLDPAWAYRFRRVSAPNMTPHHVHPNSWLLTKALFDKIGGYDETLCIGAYGTDGDIADRLARGARIGVLKQTLIRVPRDVVADASTTCLPRKDDEGRAALKQIRREIKNNPAHEIKRLTFPYERVA
jgi:hypothetical protein